MKYLAAAALAATLLTSSSAHAISPGGPSAQNAIAGAAYPLMWVGALMTFAEDQRQGNANCRPKGLYYRVVMTPAGPRGACVTKDKLPWGHAEVNKSSPWYVEPPFGAAAYGY